MPAITKISAYRSGPPRFGNRPHQIDNTVRTYKLTPEQLERLKNGESLDDILKECEDVREEKPVAGSKIESIEKRSATAERIDKRAMR